MAEEVTLYYGDNGIHAFWEDSDQKLLLFKNHGEDMWIIEAPARTVVGSDKELGSAIRNLVVNGTFSRIILDRTHEWQEPYTNRRMQLIPVTESAIV